MMESLLRVSIITITINILQMFLYATICQTAITTASFRQTKVYKMYGAECWTVRKKKRKLHTTEMCMLRWARGKTRLDHIMTNVDIWKKANKYPMAEFNREKRLRWFEHVQRRDKDESTRKILQMTVDGKRNRGRPKLRW